MSSGALPREGPGDRSLPRRALGRAAVALPVVVAASLGGPALASALTLQRVDLSAGAAAVTTCGAVGATTTRYVVRAGTGVSVAVSGFPTSCNGSALYLTLTTATAATSLGPVTLSAGAATVPVPSGPASTAVTGVHLAVVG